MWSAFLQFATDAVGLVSSVFDASNKHLLLRDSLK